VKTGIQLFQNILDPGFRRGDNKGRFPKLSYSRRDDATKLDGTQRTHFKDHQCSHHCTQHHRSRPFRICLSGMPSNRANSLPTCG